MSWRDLQEPIIRFAASAVFVGCSVAFCSTIGDVEVGTSFGLVFGLIIAGAVAAVLWGRELQEMQVRRDRRDLAGQSTGRLQLRDEDDEDVDGPRQATVRPLRISDDDD